MAIKNGIILYTIERDGCLNGVYTHEGLQGKIFNEIARKLSEKAKEKSENIDQDELVGKYACAYFEAENQEEARTARLRITKRLGNEIYDFSWSHGGSKIFKGIVSSLLCLTA